VTPVLLAIGAATEVAHLVSMPRAGIGMVAWWALLIAVPGIVYVMCSRLARRALPLAALLRMTLVFPDKAPTRMAVARRAGSTRALERQLAESRDRGAEIDEPTVAAEQILALAASLNRHDRTTRGHSERVRAFTDLIADELKLPQADRDRLRWSALLHDIGKLTVPASVLNKPGKPDDAEWRLLQGHPLEGARLAAPLAVWLGTWADTIAQHHERFDGRGYPYGIGGEDISLGGRIVAVADSYETMTSVRSYKTAMTPEVARRELVACAGTQFDPAVVRAFLDVSVGRRARLLGGALSLLGEIPLVNSVPQLGQLAGTAGQAVLATAAISGISVAAAAGMHHLPSQSHTAATSVVQQYAPPQGKPSVTLPTTPTPASPVSPQVDGPSLPPATPSNINPAVTTPPPPAFIPPALTPPALTPPALTPLTPISLPPVTPATVPTAPSAVSGVSGDGSVTLSWSAPADDGGDPVTGYTVTPYIGGSAQTPSVFASSATTQTMSGLTNGTAYTFTVIATNGAGNSPASAASPAVTPATVPTAPSAVSGVSGDGSVTLSWSAPADDGGDPVTGYTVTPYIGGSAQTPSVFASSATTQTMSGLTNGTAYTFTVIATNGAGNSPASAASPAVTPVAVGAPNAPTNVIATSVGGGEAVVNWTAPDDFGLDFITFYAITAYENGSVFSVTDVSGLGTSGVVTGLTADSTFTFTVTATNFVGTGPASAPSAPIDT
jgi:putative nucleotidyltransferase with HDIG domain